jgi:hypothetical protein
MEWMLSVGVGLFAGDTMAAIQHGAHMFVQFWNSGAHGPISDIFTHVGHTTVHVVRNAGSGIAHVYCKGKSIEVPITKNGVDISSCK